MLWPHEKNDMKKISELKFKGTKPIGWPITWRFSKVLKNIKKKFKKN
jgi:hypothetical protein